MSKRAPILLVIPAYQEGARLGRWLDELLPEMDGVGFVEVLVVDDGSVAEESRRMSSQVEARQAKYGLLRDLLILPENRGKGGAIQAGWEQAGPKIVWLGFTDADGAGPAKEVTRMIKNIRSNPGVSHFSSRVKMLGRSIAAVSMQPLSPKLLILKSTTASAGSSLSRPPATRR